MLNNKSLAIVINHSIFSSANVGMENGVSPVYLAAQVSFIYLLSFLNNFQDFKFAKNKWGKKISQNNIFAAVRYTWVQSIEL